MIPLHGISGAFGCTIGLLNPAQSSHQLCLGVCVIVQLALPIAFFCLMMLVPGYLTARSMGLSNMLAICCAPIITIGLVSVLGEVYALAGIPATPMSVLAPITILPIALLAVLSLKGGPRESATPPKAKKSGRALPFWLPMLFVAVGFAIANSVFFSELTTTDAILQSYDVTHHLNCIQAFVDARRISSLGVNFYLTPEDAAIRPYGVTAMYPSAWYALCALVMQALPISAPEAINASMAVFTGMVLPLGMLAWALLVFRRDRKAVFATALTSVAFATFPWCMLMFGPLYPNLAGFATLPATAALFMVMVRELPPQEEAPRGKEALLALLRNRGPFALLLLCALAGQALLHPNTLFSLYLIFVPYCTWRIYRYCINRRQMRRIPSLVVSALFVLLCLVVWTVCYRSPAFSSIVGEYWPSFAYSWQEVINIITQTYTLAFFNEISAQVLLGILVIIGWVCCVYDSNSLWLAVSYVVVCGVNFVGATSYSITLKQFFAGFWYTDAMRLAAMAILVAILLAARGFSWVLTMVLELVNDYNEKHHRTTHPRIVVAVLALLFLVVNFMPGFNWPGAHDGVTDAEFDELKRAGREYETLTFKTTFGDYRQLVQSKYKNNLPIDQQEHEFLREVARIVPSDALVINNPMDGSFLAYGVSGLRTYYREFGYEDGSTETEQSALVRTSLCDIASNQEVREVVDELGAQYVLVMNEKNSSSSFIELRGDYNHGAFTGISSITSDTDGFTPLLTNGACTLYSID